MGGVRRDHLILTIMSDTLPGTSILCQIHSARDRWLRNQPKADASPKYLYLGYDDFFDRFLPQNNIVVPNALMVRPLEYMGMEVLVVNTPHHVRVGA